MAEDTAIAGPIAATLFCQDHRERHRALRRARRRGSRRQRHLPPTRAPAREPSRGRPSSKRQDARRPDLPTVPPAHQPAAGHARPGGTSTSSRSGPSGTSSVPDTGIAVKVHAPPFVDSFYVYVPAHVARDQHDPLGPGRAVADHAAVRAGERLPARPGAAVRGAGSRALRRGLGEHRAADAPDADPAVDDAAVARAALDDRPVDHRAFDDIADTDRPDDDLDDPFAPTALSYGGPACVRSVSHSASHS